MTKNQWDAFIRKGKLAAGDAGLSDIVQRMREFLHPVLQALANGESFDRTWRAGGPWVA